MNAHGHSDRERKEGKSVWVQIADDVSARGRRVHESAHVRPIHITRTSLDIMWVFFGEISLDALKFHTRSYEQLFSTE